MQRSTTLEVRKHALVDTRLSEQGLPALDGGEVLARVDRFALTANNISYGVVGEKIGYWRFFPTDIVDMSGNGTVLSALHAQLGNNMRYTANVGITHYDETAMGPGFIAERSAMFFAPAHIQRRTTEWGPGVFQRKAFEFWRLAAARSRAWLRLERFAGLEGLQTAYRRVLGGEISPDRGVIVDLQGSG